MAVQLDFWTMQEIERLEKRIAAQEAELRNLREENLRLVRKRWGKKQLAAFAKRGSLEDYLR